MPLSPEEKSKRAWSRLTLVWALYYFFAFTLGQIPQYMRQTIWLGAGLVGVATVPMFWRHIRLRHIPREGVFLVLFVLWAMTGLFVITDWAMFSLFLKLVLELTLVVMAVSMILERSGEMKWFYWAYLGVAVFRVLHGEGPISLDRIADTRVVERIAGANAVGFYCVLGILGMLALLKEYNRLWIRGLLLAGGIVALYGVVLSVSRGAFAALIATAVLWPALCMVGGSRDKSKAVVGAIVVVMLSWWVFQFVIQETYMGVRFTRATQLDDGSTQTRLELFLTGLDVFLKNPVFGTGLGQFGVVSRTGHYAHNEFAEIIATTGLPGLFLYFSIYVMAWRRLSWSLQHLADPLFRYRINMARLILLILLISGFLSRPNFISQDTMFMLGIVVGVSHWAERTRRLAGGCAPVAHRPRLAPGWGAPAPALGFGLPAVPMNSIAPLAAIRSCDR